jgi:hypothetical protein
MSLPSIPHASRRVRPSTFDRRDREELRELLARLLTQTRYAATAFAVGMNMACEAPCWSEIAHGNDERAGQRADTGDVTIITANAGMIEMNFIDRLLVPFDSRSQRMIRTQLAGAADWAFKQLMACRCKQSAVIPNQVAHNLVASLRSKRCGLRIGFDSLGELPARFVRVISNIRTRQPPIRQDAGPHR